MSGGQQCLYHERPHAALLCLHAPCCLHAPHCSPLPACTLLPACTPLPSSVCIYPAASMLPAALLCLHAPCCLHAPAVPGASRSREQTTKEPCSTGSTCKSPMGAWAASPPSAQPCPASTGQRSSGALHFHSALPGCCRKTERDLKPRFAARWPGDGTPKAGWSHPAGMAGAQPAPGGRPPRMSRAMPTAGSWDVSLSPWVSWSATTSREHPTHRIIISQSGFGTSLAPANTRVGSQTPSEAQPEMLSSLLGWDTWGLSRDTSPALVQ